MKTKREDRSTVREATMTITLTNDEKELIQEEADRRGLTMSAYARSRLVLPLKKNGGLNDGKGV